MNTTLRIELGKAGGRNSGIRRYEVYEAAQANEDRARAAPRPASEERPSKGHESRHVDSPQDDQLPTQAPSMP